jgi:methylmalonyl-CoA mutase N-terminal domain/subunit
MQREIARSAYERQRRIERGEEVVVGVNRFIGEQELEVIPTRMVPHPYDPRKRAEAEGRQIANLAKVRRERDNRQVRATLKRLREAAQTEEENLIPPLVEAVEAYATIGEICDTLREVFGEYQAYNVGI